MQVFIMDLDTMHAPRPLFTSQLGCGLANLGNTCFVAAPVQMLAHCRPFSSYSMQHRDDNYDINIDSSEPARLMHQLIRDVLASPKQAAEFYPIDLVSKLHLFDSAMKVGQQVIPAINNDPLHLLALQSITRGHIA